MLNEFDISYQSCPVMKVQVLADFIAECTWTDREVSQENADKECPEPTWILHVNGTSNSLSSRVGLILTNLEKVVAECTSVCLPSIK